MRVGDGWAVLVIYRRDDGVISVSFCSKEQLEKRLNEDYWGRHALATDEKLPEHHHRAEGSPSREGKRAKKAMSESVIFQCDFCGGRSEEEPTAWPRPKRCRVELVLPPERFHVTEREVASPLYIPMPPPPHGIALPPLPFFPGPVGAAFPPAAFPMPMPISPGASSPEPIHEDEGRWTVSLCDQCARRIAALFDLHLETLEEHQSKLARQAPPAPLPGSGLPTAMKGEMIAQYETEPPDSKPGSGGLVKQYRTPRSRVGGGDLGAVAPEVGEPSPQPAVAAEENPSAGDADAGDADDPKPKVAPRDRPTVMR